MTPNDFQSLTIFAKSSILDVLQGSEYASVKEVSLLFLIGKGS